MVQSFLILMPSIRRIIDRLCLDPGSLLRFARKTHKTPKTYKNPDNTILLQKRKFFQKTGDKTEAKDAKF
jgi:hypothetical protein